jgi:signal transduction histidine kinase
LSALAGVWKLGSPNGRVIALFHTGTIRAHMRGLLAKQGLEREMRAEIAPPGETVPSETTIQTMPAGRRLPGWQLTLARVGPDPFEELAGKQMTLYLWIGFLMTAAVVALALVAARGISRSLRLAGMKTDLVATVSHELKTPVSSMRLLVDTLLDDPVLDPVKTREYLELIARENTRLSQLVANFLAFSRMERRKYAFEFAPARVEDVVRAAVDAAGERFEEPGCELRVSIAPDLPEIRADAGALVTALVNLLDNAYKYTPGDKQIMLRAFSASGAVCFEVCDNGIGIAPRDIRKIFRKYYQADRRLARTGGGCGLGLAIVRFLVEAHGGSVRVFSEPGKGSTFTVILGAPA